jgi:hypothetical protein
MLPYVAGVALPFRQHGQQMPMGMLPVLVEKGSMWLEVSGAPQLGKKWLKPEEMVHARVRNGEAVTSGL